MESLQVFAAFNFLKIISAAFMEDLNGPGFVDLFMHLRIYAAGPGARPLSLLHFLKLQLKRIEDISNRLHIIGY